MFARLRSLVRTLTRRRMFETDLDQELQSHIDQYTQDLVRSGLSREEAQRRARVEFGWVNTVKDECRQAKGLGAFDGLSLDLKLGGRMLVKYPGLTIVGGLAMASAICVGAVVFEVLTPFVHPTLPLPAGERIVQIPQLGRRGESSRAARPARLRRLARRATVGDRARCLAGRHPQPDRRRW